MGKDKLKREKVKEKIEELKEEKYIYEGIVEKFMMKCMKYEKEITDLEEIRKNYYEGLVRMMKENE
jgi:hypothetical protein